MRKVTAPDGTEWKVGRQWLPRRPRFRDDLVDLPNIGDGGASVFDDVGGLVAGIALVALAFVILLVLFPIVVLAFELLLVLVLLIAGIAGRLLLGKPWHVLARTGGAAYRWPVKGWRASGERAEQVAGQLASGHMPLGAELLKR